MLKRCNHIDFIIWTMRYQSSLDPFPFSFSNQIIQKNQIGLKKGLIEKIKFYQQVKIQTYACQNYLNHRPQKQSSTERGSNAKQDRLRIRKPIYQKPKIVSGVIEIGLIEKIRFYQQRLIQTYACQNNLNHRPKIDWKSIIKLKQGNGLRIWVVI